MSTVELKNPSLLVKTLSILAELPNSDRLIRIKRLNSRKVLAFSLDRSYELAQFQAIIILGNIINVDIDVIVDLSESMTFINKLREYEVKSVFIEKGGIKINLQRSLVNKQAVLTLFLKDIKNIVKLEPMVNINDINSKSFLAISIPYSILYEIISKYQRYMDLSLNVKSNKVISVTLSGRTSRITFPLTTEENMLENNKECMSLELPLQYIKPLKHIYRLFGTHAFEGVDLNIKVLKNDLAVLESMLNRYCLLQLIVHARCVKTYDK